MHKIKNKQSLRSKRSSKIKIKKGDQVKILLGKDRGKEGKVAFILGKESKVFIEGANLYKRHVRKMPASRGEQGIEGGIIDLPKPVDVSNVGLICPNCKKTVKIGYKIEKGVKARICRKCRKEIK